jgi:hypothetical protein
MLDSMMKPIHIWIEERRSMRLNYKKISATVLCATLAASFVCASPKKKGKGHHSKDNSYEEKVNAKAIIFDKADCEMIRLHYSSNRDKLPPGLAKRDGDLPPGLAKQLRRNGHLPPGLEKKLHPFPVELERRLPPLREGLVRGFVGGNAVIYNKNTSIILDVFSVF